MDALGGTRSGSFRRGTAVHLTKRSASCAPTI